MSSAIHFYFDSHVNRERGAAAVEFALILPLLVLIIFLLIDFGRFFFVANSMVGASQEAVRVLAFEATDAQAQSITVAGTAMTSAAKVASLSGSPTTVTSVSTACTGSPRIASFKITITFQWLTPISLLQSFGNESASSQRTMTTTGVRLCAG